jgi:ABC-type Fe3+-siderophore transport system permease subunit
MPKEADIDFFEKWTTQRHVYKNATRPFFIGLSAGISIGIAILLSIYLGWYQRANMELNSNLNPFVFLIAIVGISIFMAFIYRNYQWEKNEQRYLSILARKKQTEIHHQMQP